MSTMQHSKFIYLCLSSPHVAIMLTSQVFSTTRYHGVYFGEDVAVKVLRSEHLNNSLEVEFAQETAILR